VKRDSDAVVSHTMHSTGEYVFLTAIETLRDGRLAFLGSTGSFGAFVSTDTDAMLLVADSSGNDLTALQIVSTIVDYSAGASIH
jgi:uridylate kinase